MKFSPFRRIHFPAGKRVRAIALLGISAFVLASGEAADAAEIYGPVLRRSADES